MAQKLSSLRTKPVIERDTLPMAFPHYAIIYSILAYFHLDGWKFWLVIILMGLWVMVYISRKLIEKPEMRIQYLKKNIDNFN